MENPNITVLMPVYNGEKYLRLAIESILTQTYTNFEFLIINDGSTDKSEEIILSYQDNRIRYIKNETNLKLIKTLNKGIDLARGNYIARMDCDDISFSDRLEVQLKYLKKNPDIDGVCGMVVDLLPNNVIKRSLRYLPLHKDAFRFTSLLEISFCHPCLLIKTDVLKKEKFSDNEYAVHIEDMELGSRLSQKGYNIEVINKYLIYYRKNENGICFTHREEQKTKSYNIVKRNIIDNFDIKLSLEFYSLLTDKSGFNKGCKLKTALFELNKLIGTYLNQNKNLDNKNKKDINEWKHLREYSFLISALKESKTFKDRIIVLKIFLQKMYYIFDMRFIKYVFIWLDDYSKLAKEKYL